MNSYTIDEMKNIHDRYDKSIILLEQIRTIDALIEIQEDIEIVTLGYNKKVADNIELGKEISIASGKDTNTILSILRDIKNNQLEELIEKKE